MMESLRSVFFIIDRIPSFDVRCWTFEVRRSLVSFLINLAAFRPNGGAEPMYGDVYALFVPVDHLLGKVKKYILVCRNAFQINPFMVRMMPCANRL